MVRRLSIFVISIWRVTSSEFTDDTSTSCELN
jgi:hypothetical protein